MYESVWDEAVAEAEVTNRLRDLDEGKRIAFASACAYHILHFAMKLFGLADHPQLSDLEDVLDRASTGYATGGIGRRKASELIAEVESMYPATPDDMEEEDTVEIDQDLLGWFDLTEAVILVCRCGEGMDAVEAARGVSYQAYNAVFKWFCLRNYDVLGGREIYEAEKKTSECLDELSFQLACLRAIESLPEAFPSYTAILKWTQEN